MGKIFQICTQDSLYNGDFGGKAGWHAAGMGYVIVTDLSEIIVIDGGYDKDAASLVQLLCEITESPTAHVSAWILTHPHSDHTGAIEHIARCDALRGKISLDTLIYHFPPDFVDSRGATCNLSPIKSMEETRYLLRASYHKPRLDESLLIDGVKIRFLYTPDDITLLSYAGNSNLCSLIFSVESASKRAIFTGDAYERSLQMTVWRYVSQNRNELKGDILQMPHHGLCDTGSLDFYRAVDASVLLIPTCVAGEGAMRSDMYAGSRLREYNIQAKNNAEKIYYSFEGTAIIDF